VAEPQLLIRHREQGVDLLALVRGNLHLERAGQVHDAELGVPAEPHAVLAPVAADLGRELIVVLPLKWPFVGNRDLLDQIQRIARRGFGLGGKR
jgi:hypothetical protein